MSDFIEIVKKIDSLNDRITTAESSIEILKCELSEARADALRMARVVYDMQSFDCSTCVRRDCPFGENDICNECSECDKWEAIENSDAFEANEIIAKYEEQ